jgi:glucosamine 6-phosphate synthetase-like amidotransferase/phosphosugar isomerase protein
MKKLITGRMISMCAIMGLIDVHGVFNAKDRSFIIRRLAVVSESRGTDATGFAYNSSEYLVIHKNPKPARRMKLKLPQNAKVIIGHTRMTTQGTELRNYNNHPFMGRVHNNRKFDDKAQPPNRFALVHNGMIYNDDALKIEYDLPKTKIETDSYVAVQLIERQKSLSFDSLKFMAEQVFGIFTFAILDNQNNVWLVKGDNPVCLHYSIDYGFYVFTSTEEIMTTALKSLGLDTLRYEQVQVKGGEILKISEHGVIERGKFQHDEMSCGYMNTGYGRFTFSESMAIKALKDSASLFGADDDDVDILLYSGYDPSEIEELFNYPQQFRSAVYYALYDSCKYNEGVGEGVHLCG